MSWRMFALLLSAPLLAIGGLVFAIDRWRDGHGNGGVGMSGTPTEPAAPPAPGSERPLKAPDAQAARLRLVRVGTFDRPLYVDAPAGDRTRVFVVEQPGRIRVLENGRKLGRPFLDISGDTNASGEQGLLGLAFAPDYATSGRFYVDFTDNAGNTRIQEFRRSQRDPNLADTSSRRQLLKIDQPFANHNGGQLAFGPDGHLYIGMGDGGSAGDPQNRAQNLNGLLGKILRIDPRPAAGRSYRIPRSNPFVGRRGRDEIYAYGLRNPWRFSFDRRTGDLYIGDVGQSSYEEVDFARRGSGKGRNYGWSCREGRHIFNSARRCPGAIGPVFEYPRTGANCSVTGGLVVRDARLASLRGRYVYGDFCAGQLRSFKVRRGRARARRTLRIRRVPQLSSFGSDAAGRAYAVSLDGPVYRLQR